MTGEDYTSDSVTFKCPICGDQVTWTEDYAYEVWNGSEYVVLDPETIADPDKRNRILNDSRRRCPNPSQDTPVHRLPSRFGLYRNSIVIGLVGERRTGKSHLLAALISAIEHGELQPYGLTVVPMDYARHADYLRDKADPLLKQGHKLPGTTEADSSDFTDSLLIRSPAGVVFPVTFFDLAGEKLTEGSKSSRLLLGANALMFCVSPGPALGVTDEEDEEGGRESSDRALNNILDRLNTGQLVLDIPAAIVVTKSDRLRYQPPVDRWIRRPGLNGWIDPAAILEESRDAYAFLHSRGARAWLRPYGECRQCTLHFASATGSENRQERFPGGVTPRRVLEPLIALLAMRGVFGEALAEEVGR
ncbi:hypothetical protein Lfu02_41710 [Longispora fulva]|uniref:Uncharacterized protein n=1 Tax=Longispora fulva TaxID=619741 RepID=A0A8J7GEX1_9ACTN|nr:hypothetical protein [Longispora fulva]MBG6136630.1 hypothetical protein [Longispora fulva]GIG59799.1 hypothetical protein Lfu02_41710 [Longispora fulva]